jgi:phenylalanyl-tRNA synthetase beta chain
MKISLNGIRYNQELYKWSDDTLAIGHVALEEKIGAQLGAIEEVLDISKKYEGILIVTVVSCTKLEGSDHLNVCKVDDGRIAPNVERDEQGYVQVVCGAPNVKEGVTVAWLPPGTTVPESVSKEPFVLEARVIRGVKSNGMLASGKELAIGDNHEGLLLLDVDIAPGTSFAKQYGLAGDYIIDIENKMFTHRPDCFGMMGVARELAGIQQMPFKSPAWYVENPVFPSVEGTTLALEVRNELPELVPRFAAIAMSGVEVKPSPLWLQIELSKVGLKPINNIVDYTNYYMLLTGQPLHAYDYDKVAALSAGTAKLIVRYPKPGETIQLLNGKAVEPRSEAIMIATDTEPIGIGGVMGGSGTEVDSQTTNIILECATFDMYSIRRTSMANGLFTDAVTRFTKGQSPLQNLAVLAKIVDEIRTSVNGKVASVVIDDQHLPAPLPAIQLSARFINERLGSNLSAEAISDLLSHVEFTGHSSDEDITIDTIPFWRTDIEIPEDIVEEVGRLYGYDKLPLVLPTRSIMPAKKDELLELKFKIRAALARAGANEVLTYSFVHSELLRKVGQTPDDAFQIANALSPELQYYRLSLTPSLLEKIHPNVKAGYDEFALFEIGKGHNLKHHDADGLPMEFEMLDLVYAATDKTGKPGAAFYEARKFLVVLLAELGVTPEFRPFEAEEDYPVVKPYDNTRSAKVFVKGTDEALGMIGEYKQSVIKSLKLPPSSAGFGLGLTQLLSVAKTTANYVPQPRFPKVTQDITLKLPVAVSFQALFDCVWAALHSEQTTDMVAVLRPLDIYQNKDDQEHKQITLRLSIASYEKTLTDSEVSRILEGVTELTTEKLAAERI